MRGLRDLAAGFEKEMGIHVEVQTLNMAKMVDELKSGAAPAGHRVPALLP